MGEESMFSEIKLLRKKNEFKFSQKLSKNWVKININKDLAKLVILPQISEIPDFR